MSIAEALRVRIEMLPDQAPVRVADMRRSLGVSHGEALDQAFSRLVKHGALIRLAKGVYWKGRRGRFGMVKPSTLEAALVVAADRFPGPAGPSAAAYLGLTTQIPPLHELAVLGRETTRLPNVLFRARSNMRRIGLCPAEVAVLEVARDSGRFCEVNVEEMLARITALAARGEINLRHVQDAAEMEGPVVRTFIQALA